MWNHKRYLIIGIIAGVLLTLAAGGGYEFLAGYGILGAKVTPGSSVAGKKIDQIEALIDDYYLYDTKDEKLTEAMYAGLVNGVEDPYSCYYTKEEYKIVNETTEGQYKGIGIVMIQDKETKAVIAAHCYEGSPAQKAGVRDGDTIYKIDNTVLEGVSLEAVGAMIRSSAADTVHLTLIREGEPDYVEVDVTKAAIEIPVVDVKMLADQKGYIAIRQFTAATPQQFKEACEKLHKQQMKSLIVDLRDNPGGLLSSVCETLDQFMPAGLLVYTEDKYKQKTEYKSSGKTPLDIPLAVLINKNSASAAEIFAGAVKDHKMGTLVGTTTFGKGIVQKIFELADGSVVKLTISSYYSPAGVNIHGKGIKPDVEVEQKIPANQEGPDQQLEKAIEILK